MPEEKKRKLFRKPSRRALLAAGGLVVVLAAAFVIFGLDLFDDIGSKNVGFKQLAKDEVPQAIETEVVPEYRELERALGCLVDGKVYVLVTRGEKPTAGYSASIEELRLVKSKDGSIIHSGDNLTGDGEGDDEVINVTLANVPAEVNYLVFTVSSYRGQTFNEVANAYCRLVDDSGKEVARYTISGGGDYTAMIMAKLYRHNGEWKMQAVGESMRGKTVADMIAPITAIL